MPRSSLARFTTPRQRNQLDILVRLARRQIASRYKESSIGIFWSVLNPLILLGIYAFVFSQVFEARFETETGDKASFALALFSGIILFNLFAEIANSAAFLVQSNAAMVKRTNVSPAILPPASALSALMTMGLSFVPFSALYLIVEGLPPLTILLLPLLVLELIVLALGISYFVAGAAVYVRDLQQLVPLATTSLLFMSPIFFPDERIPENVRTFLLFVNPLAAILPASKDVIFFGKVPDLVPLAIYAAVAVLVLLAGRRFFRVAQRGFGDVI